MQPSKDLVAASSVPMILAILRQGDSYGYRIIKTVETASDGGWLWSEGMLYPVLHKLEKSGWISSYWSTESSRRRKYYRLEESGLSNLRDQMEQWKQVDNILNRVWNDGEAR